MTDIELAQIKKEAAASLNYARNRVLIDRIRALRQRPLRGHVANDDRLSILSKALLSHATDSWPQPSQAFLIA